MPFCQMSVIQNSVFKILSLKHVGLPVQCYITDVPEKVDVIKEMCSKTHVSFSHFVPAESKFYKDIAYKVVELGSSREEKELNGRLIDRHGKKSLIVDGYAGRSIKVCVYFKDNPKLGVVYSDKYEGTYG